MREFSLISPKYGMFCITSHLNSKYMLKLGLFSIMLQVALMLSGMGSAAIDVFRMVSGIVFFF